MKRIFAILLGVLVHLYSVQHVNGQDQKVSGVIVDSGSGVELPGTLITAMPGRISTVSGENGEFSLNLAEGSYELTVQFMGYATLKKTVTVPVGGILKLSLESLELGLDEVQVFATGYQEIPKTRSTGSFVGLEEELIDRRVSTNLLDRIEDITSGLVINRTGDVGRDPITIRGRSTLGRFSQPLIVIDNFPYDGSLEDVNPNDVASITVLRDAAAASIWGARAGNGVIVITTKSGKKDQPLKISLTANTNWIEKADPFLAPNLSVDDFIDVEKKLFEGGYYNSTINSLSNPAITPVVELLAHQRSGVISEDEAMGRINQLRRYDLRRDASRYLLQSVINQQYSLGLSGGSQTHQYRVALGYDHQQLPERGNSSDRLSLDLKNDFVMAGDRLKLRTGLYAVKNREVDQNMGMEDLFFTSAQPMYPYAGLADQDGNPLEVYRQYNQSLKDSAAKTGLLDWRYVPLNEMGNNQTTLQTDDWRINLGLDYLLMKNLTVGVLYQYWQNNAFTETDYTKDSYYAREQINLFTQVAEAGNLIRNIPSGGILDRSVRRSGSHSARAMADYTKEWTNWELSSLIGAELKTLDWESNSSRYYGFDPERSSIQMVDYRVRYPQFNDPRLSQLIPNRESLGAGADRFYSVFANASLGYDARFLLTLSARKDASNLFGVEANQKTVPLWSAGGSWTLSEEDFYKWDALPYVRIRVSYGYNGNVDRSLSAFTTARIVSNNSLTQLPYAQIVNPPNRNLRWEKIRISNLGLDLESRNGRINATVELYRKAGLDLIGQSPYAPSSGIGTFTGNTASTLTRGYDVMLETQNLKGNFNWETTLLWSGVKEEVTGYEVDPNPSSLLNYGAAGLGGEYFPVVGRPLFGIYSLPWAGLNPETGAPVGMLDGDPSENYRNIINSSTVETINYHGPARPTLFGSVRNTFSYKGFSLSANISFRMGYWFRRSSVQYTSILTGRGGHADYALRWQNPGDEGMTQVPSEPISLDVNRDTFYRNSEVLIEKGSHVRFQDIRLGYLAGKKTSGMLSSFARLEIFLYANNLGMIWKATDSDWDPDFGWAIPRRSLALGVNLEF